MCFVRVYRAFDYAFIRHLLLIYCACGTHVSRVLSAALHVLSLFRHSQGVLSGMSNLVMILLLRSGGRGKRMTRASEKNPFPSPTLAGFESP